MWVTVVGTPRALVHILTPCLTCVPFDTVAVPVYAMALFSTVDAVTRVELRSASEGQGMELRAGASVVVGGGMGQHMMVVM